MHIPHLKCFLVLSCNAHSSYDAHSTPEVLVPPARPSCDAHSTPKVITPSCDAHSASVVISPCLEAHTALKMYATSQKKKTQPTLSNVRLDEVEWLFVTPQPTPSPVGEEQQKLAKLKKDIML